MKTDRLTKVLLACITMFLGMIALKPAVPGVAMGAAKDESPGHFERFQIGAGTTYISVFDTSTGDLRLYGMGHNGKEMSSEPYLSARIDDAGRPSALSQR